MNFNTNRETIEGKSFVQKVFTPGIQLVKINQVELKDAAWGRGEQTVKLWLEGEEIKDFEGFKTYADIIAKGLVGEVDLVSGNFDSGADTQDKLNSLDSLLNNLAYIAEKAGVANAFKTLGSSVNTLEQLLNEFSKLVKNKFIWVVLGGREWEKGEKKGVNLFLVTTKIKVPSQLSYFQLYCKHKDFANNVVTDDKGVQKLEGFNVVGANIGKKDALNYDPNNEWFYKPLTKVASDTEPTLQASMDDF